MAVLLSCLVCRSSLHRVSFNVSDISPLSCVYRRARPPSTTSLESRRRQWRTLPSWRSCARGAMRSSTWWTPSMSMQYVLPPMSLHYLAYLDSLSSECGFVGYSHIPMPVGCSFLSLSHRLTSYKQQQGSSCAIMHHLSTISHMFCLRSSFIWLSLVQSPHALTEQRLFSSFSSRFCRGLALRTLNPYPFSPLCAGPAAEGV